MVVLRTLPGATGAELAFETGLDKMAVSRALAALERAGRIVRQTDSRDRRMGRVSFTPAGFELYRVIEVTARRREVDLFRAVTPRERAQLGAIVERMTAGLIAIDRASAPALGKRRRHAQKPKGS